MDPIDAYLLDGLPAKAETVKAVLANRRPVERAQPFYRALELLGARVADEALIALRLALAGKTPDDEAVRTLRSHVAAARRGDSAARDAYFRALETA